MHDEEVTGIGTRPDSDTTSDTTRDTDSGAVLTEVAARSAAQMAAENFPVALRLLPSRPRGQLARVYRFARFVDDVGDEAPGDRCALLDLVDHDLQVLWAGGTAGLTPVRDLRPLVDLAVPIDPFRDLIEANRVDQRVGRYETFDQLMGYCRLSAAPVGRIVLHLAGAATPANIADSDAVCNGLQVLEHCQDVGEDARAGRVYLPATDLRAEHVADADLSASSTSAPLRRVVARQVARADELLDSGRPLVRRLHGWARFAVAGYVAGGRATSDALNAADFDVLARAVRPGKARTARHATRLLVGR